MLVLRHFVSNNKYKLSAKESNRRLKRFAYSFIYDMKNKPSPRSTDPLLRKEKNISSFISAISQCKSNKQIPSHGTLSSYHQGKWFTSEILEYAV
jgi:hypothetical protein